MKLNTWWPIPCAAGLLALQALTLHLLGHPWICACGYVKLWEGDVLSSGNSQHLTDWYTFSHIIHGMLFYALLRFAFPKMSLSKRLLIAVCIEVTWEITENTPTVIQHYRQQALAQGYVGDSILNSLSDSVTMMVGFVVAWQLPAWASVCLVLGLELWVGYEIRDNLTFNIINFIYPFEFIRAWQAGG